ncbi:TYDP2 phosphodiesterase, partial [Ramphastos sulfuratus]|nr:TYDP2 phosphodiesterase [Ramphastos sulfuratus]
SRCPEAGEPLPVEEQQQQGEEEESLHLAKRRKVLCGEFVAITCSDTVVAQSFLAGNDWHLQVGPGPDAGLPRGCGAFPTSAIRPCVSEGSGRLFRAENGEGDEDKVHVKSPTLFCLALDSQQCYLSVVNLKSSLGDFRYNPDVVFLQEVVPPHLGLLQKRLGNYTIIPGNIDAYFTAIMLKKSRVKLLKHEIVPFPTTSMMRNLLVVHVSVSGMELCLMTSHLESTKTHSKERVKQLQIVLKRMQEEPESTTVIFGGDTNLRDSEV